MTDEEAGCTGAGFAAAWASVGDVQGWLTEGQARELWAAARSCPPGGTIVEIGSFHGRSTIVLAMAAPPDADVIAIDPHAGNDRGPREIDGYETEAADDHETFLSNLRAAGVAERVRHIRVCSAHALAEVNTRIDVLYVDGAHRYAPARWDIANFGARVRTGGTMLIHDSFSSIGVTAAILRELVPSRRWRYERRSRSLAVYRARSDVARLTNATRQLAQLAWFAKNIALKLALTAGAAELWQRAGRRPPDWPY